MPSFDTKAQQQHQRELKEQLKSQVDLNKDGKLNREERDAFNAALKNRTEIEKRVQQDPKKTEDGYQRSRYSRAEPDRLPDEQKHGYAPSYAEKRFTGRDAGTTPKAEADVKFRFDSHDLTPEAQRAVSDVAAEIHRIKRENNGVLPAGTKITVHGHTDSIGDASYNQSLSEQRAKTAKDEIVKATGIDPKLIEVVGHGEKNPVADNTTHEGRALNRRVEIDVKAPVKEKEQEKPAPAPEQKKEQPKPEPAAPADKKVEVKPASATEQKKEEPKPEPAAPADKKVEVKPAPAPEQKKEQPKPAPAAPADKKVEVSPQEKAAAEKQKALVAAVASLDTGIPENASVAQAREWRDNTMKLYNSLDDSGKKIFTLQIQRDYRYAEGQQTFDPVSFFDQRIAQAAVGELKGATTTTTRTYTPLSTSRVAPPPVTTQEIIPDPIKIHTVLRQIADLHDVLPRVQADPAVQEIRNKLPKKTGWFEPVDGVHQEALDARLRGDAVRAEAGLVRSLIENTLDRNNPRLDEATKKAIKDAFAPYSPAIRERINDEYKSWFETDLSTDLKKAKASVIVESTTEKRSDE
jgi:outer membrane protein OmpA-like peptidoglycan-associated protein